MNRGTFRSYILCFVASVMVANRLVTGMLETKKSLWAHAGGPGVECGCPGALAQHPGVRISRLYPLIPVHEANVSARDIGHKGGKG